MSTRMCSFFSEPGAAVAEDLRSCLSGAGLPSALSRLPVPPAPVHLPLDLGLVVCTADLVASLPALITTLLERKTRAIVAVLVGATNPWPMRDALAMGMFDFFHWPAADGEAELRVRRAIGVLDPPLADRAASNAIRGVIGASPALRKVLECVPRMAACDAGVMISGETGTGKEVFAQAIHYHSARASRPWVAVNCGAIPVDLLESELFGHVRGAFTHAHAARPGLVAEADGGTLFLDDVDCLPLLAQAKLLRFLQEREYRPVGANGVRQADVRVIAASNRNLRTLAHTGEFREDLYFRLNVLPLVLPPLRERREDIAPLAMHFAARFARQFQRPPMGLSPGALRELLAYAWPGNVRELQHVMERAVLLAPGPVIGAGDLDLPGRAEVSELQGSLQAAKARCVESFERGFIERLLDEHHGNISHAARCAGKNRRAFFALLRKYAIDAQRFRDAR